MLLLFYSFIYPTDKLSQSLSEDGTIGPESIVMSPEVIADCPWQYGE